ncbi:Replication factor C subunit 3 isoform B [Glycine soja]|uniref:Replication factor C subunit 3 isoform B n=1 Tax=Glycine soja TaxID=3848 RepID=A0A445M4D8_GLYSO|nr:Replication factor C subunit 3 isoform B [Glycine soja]
MDQSSPYYNRFPQTPSSTKKGRSGYEPSDTETERQEIPRHERERRNFTLEETKDFTLMNKSPMALHRRHPSRFENEVSSASTASAPRRRHHSKSPYKLRVAEADVAVAVAGVASSSPIIGLNTRRNISPLSRPDIGRTVSPFREQRIEKPHYKRSVTAPRLRIQESNNGGRTNEMVNRQREASPFKAPSVGEINEMIAQVKLSQDPTSDYSSVLESTDSIHPGDLFFSRECNAFQAKNSSLPRRIEQREHFSPRPPVNTTRVPSERKGKNADIKMNMNILSRSTTVLSTSATSRKGSGTGKPSSVTSESSGKTTESMRKFTVNRKKNQKDTWFSCMRTGNCRTTRKSPERRPIDESSFIERAVVVESLPQFWADKHQPASLNGFICNRQEAQLLKELVSQGSCPHILLQGPSGSGKRELAMALLREIYGDACCNLSHDLRHFPIQDQRLKKVSVPITSSSHHMELDVNSESNAKYALMGLIKEISNIYAVAPEVSNINFKSDFKVIVLYDVHKAVDNIRHIIKWIIDRYSDICKLVLCCEDDADIIEHVKNRFKVIQVDAPQNHEIIEVLIQIAKNEEIDLSMNFAAKIATKSKQNLRKAIMALEACKAHNYPFSAEQPIPVGWEEIVIEVAAEILADPSFSRLLSIRGKFQMLLLDFVHPKLILQKLVGHLLKRIEVSLRRELYYWHAYYNSWPSS